MNQPTKSLRRGMSLIEGMISMVVLIIGILGALQGILFASQQNAVAARLARSTSMAAQIRLGLEAQGRTKLLAGVVANACAAPGSALDGLTDGLAGISTAGVCVIDVDAFDGGALGGGTGGGAAQLDKLVPSYKFTEDFNGDLGLFRRVIVYVPTATVDTFAVIVSTRDTGRRVFVTQFVALYNSAPEDVGGNGTGVNL